MLMNSNQNVSKFSFCRNLELFLGNIFCGVCFFFFKGGFPTLDVQAPANLSYCKYFSILMLPWLRRCINLDNIVIKTFFLSTLMSH